LVVDPNFFHTRTTQPIISDSHSGAETCLNASCIYHAPVLPFGITSRRHLQYGIVDGVLILRSAISYRTYRQRATSVLYLSIFTVATINAATITQTLPPSSTSLTRQVFDSFDLKERDMAAPANAAVRENRRRSTPLDLERINVIKALTAAEYSRRQFILNFAATRNTNLLIPGQKSDAVKAAEEWVAAWLTQTDYDSEDQDFFRYSVDARLWSAHGRLILISPAADG
jgi:hypothetical protein